MKLTCAVAWIWAIVMRTHGDQVEVLVYTFDAGNRDATTSHAILNYSQHLYKLGIYSVDQPFKFKVKACTDVHVFMSSSQFLEYSYPFHNVVIGGSDGAKIFLRHVSDGQYYSRIEGTAVDDLLNCLNYREFWVTWRNATLKAGRGLIEGENQLDALLLPSNHVIDVRGIGIMTSHGSIGQWLVYKDSKRQARYCLEDDTTAELTVWGTIKSVGPLKCSAVCEPNTNCLGFHHKVKTQTCDMLLVTSYVLVLKYAPNINFYKKC